LAYNVAVPVPEEPEYVPKRRIRMVDAWLNRIGVSPKTPSTFRPVLRLTPEDERDADQWIKSENLEGKKFAVIMPVHKHPICRWRPEGFRSVGLHLSQMGLKVYVAWGPGEETLAQAVRSGQENVLLARPPDSLRKFAAVLKRSSFLLANNSGSMHLAVAVGTPTVTIYGPTRAVDWNPSRLPESDNGKDIVVEAADVACLGCRLKDCPVGHLCMTHLEERTVLNACQAILNRT
jgi:ADP-heptose:LPS heptosyltransferase